MAQLARLSQIRKYGGIAAWKKEMARRGSLGGKARKTKKEVIDKKTV